MEVPNGQPPGAMDLVYLKNVLLQFLEQKDKKHQMQLVPVLGMLLHFDRSVVAHILDEVFTHRVVGKTSKNGCQPSPRRREMKWEGEAVIKDIYDNEQLLTCAYRHTTSAMVVKLLGEWPWLIG